MSLTVFLLTLLFFSMLFTFISGNLNGTSCTSSEGNCSESSNFSFCNNEKCLCKLNYDQLLTNESFCEKYILLSACNEDVNFSDIISESYFLGDKPYPCSSSYLSKENKTICVRNKLTEVKCTVDSECHDIAQHSFCSEFQTCNCISGYIENEEYECLDVFLSSNNSCQNSSECSPIIKGSKCMNGRCWKTSGNIQADNSPCRSIQIFDRCFNDTDCRATSLLSYCSENKTCLCQSGHYADESLQSCVRRKIGDSGCLVDSDCKDVVNESLCHEGICMCKSGYKPDTDGTSCLKIIIGDSCISNIECSSSINQSMCDKNNTCICNSGYASSEDFSTCCRRRIGDKNCFTKIDCSDSILNSHCSVEGECICDPGHYPHAEDPYTCIRRKLGDNSTCLLNKDCSSVIYNSICSNNTCKCILGYIQDNEHCRARILGDSCSSDEDCNVVIQLSFCSVTFLCACVSGFAEITNVTCQKRRIGDRNCEIDADCYDAVVESECRAGKNIISDEVRSGNVSINESYVQIFSERNDTCLCKYGFYEENNGTSCTLRQIGDSCLLNQDCSYAVKFSICDKTWNNCTCDYDHMVVYPDMTTCVDRPVIEQYNAERVLRSYRRMHGCGRVSQYHKHSQQCAMANPCNEGGRMRDVYRKQLQCQRINAYEVRLHCPLIVGRYELVPLRFNSSFEYNKTSDAYWENSLRLSYYGVDNIMQESNNSGSNPVFYALANRYLSSRTLHFELKRDGIEAIVAIFFRLGNSTDTDMENINNMMLHYFERFKGRVGFSKIYVSEPYNQSFHVEDYDECITNSSYPAVRDSTIERNDCNQNAFCTNLQGTYQCVCDMRFNDKSDEIEFPGRICTYKETIEIELPMSERECTDAKCSTPWSFVIFVTTIIFGLLFLLLVVEIVWRMKQMSRNLDEKCRRQTAQLELKLALMKEERRRNINHLLGRPSYLLCDQEKITQTDLEL